MQIMETKTMPRVLLVEDNSVNSLYTAQVLLRQGYEVIEARNGIEALDILRTQSFDLILMDVRMPVLDGLETTRRIREDLHLDTPVVALTAHAMSGDRDKCLASGMNYYLAKPYTKAQLLGALKEVEADLGW